MSFVATELTAEEENDDSDVEPAADAQPTGDPDWSLASEDDEYEPGNTSVLLLLMIRCYLSCMCMCIISSSNCHMVTIFSLAGKFKLLLSISEHREHDK